MITRAGRPSLMAKRRKTTVSKNTRYKNKETTSVNNDVQRRKEYDKEESEDEIEMEKENSLESDNMDEEDDVSLGSQEDEREKQVVTNVYMREETSDSISRISSTTGGSDSSNSEINDLPKNIKSLWKQQKVSMTSVFRDCINVHYLPKYKFDNIQIANNVVQKSIKHYGLVVTEGMETEKYIDLASKTIVTTIFNSSRHNIQSKLRAAYISKH